MLHTKFISTLFGFSRINTCGFSTKLKKLGFYFMKYNKN